MTTLDKGAVPPTGGRGPPSSRRAARRQRQICQLKIEEPRAIVAMDHAAEAAGLVDPGLHGNEMARLANDLSAAGQQARLSWADRTRWSELCCSTVWSG